MWCYPSNHPSSDAVSEKAERVAEWKLAKHKKKCVEPATVKQTAQFVTMLVSMMAGPLGYQVLARRTVGLVLQTFRVPGLCFAC